VARHSVTAVSAGQVQRIRTTSPATTSYRSTPDLVPGSSVIEWAPSIEPVRCVRPSGERISKVVTPWTIAVKLDPKKVLTELRTTPSFSANIRLVEEWPC
jgi:hypothetical protein